MSDLDTQQNQQELFAEYSVKTKRAERFPSLARSQKPIMVTTSTEQILLAVIVLILIFCVVFFLGMLRGKVVAQKAFDELQMKRTAQPAPVSVRLAPQEVAARPVTAAPVRPIISARPVAPIKPQVGMATAQPSGTSANVTQAAAVSNRLTALAGQSSLAARNKAKPYTVQLVTHRKKDQAENELLKVRRMGYNAFIVPSGEFYQICVGQYANSKEAKKDLQALKAKYRDCYIRRY